jgi:hypothetical protein
MIVGQIIQDDLARRRAEEARAKQVPADPRIAEMRATLKRARSIPLPEFPEWCAEADNREPRRGCAERLRDAWRRWWARGRR